MDYNSLIKYFIIGIIIYSMICLFSTNFDTLKRLPVFVLVTTALIAFKSTIFSPFQEIQKEKVNKILDDLRAKLDTENE